MPRLSPNALFRAHSADRAYACSRLLSRTERLDDEITARLHALVIVIREAAEKKQETPSPGRPEVSTTAASKALDGMAASAKSDTSW